MWRAARATGWGDGTTEGLTRHAIYGSSIAMTMDVEAEIRDRKRRVSEIEGSFGFLTEQVKSVHKDLLRFEEKTDRKLQEHDGRFDRLEQNLKGLRTDMPKIVGNVMREVLRERGDKA
jgi:hypothetical protein